MHEPASPHCPYCGAVTLPAAATCAACSAVQVTRSVQAQAVGGAARQAAAILWLEGFQPTPRYTVVRVIGSGGFGTTYLAHDHQLDRQCVIKQLRPRADSTPAERDQQVARFAREARLLATLNEPGHPNIPPIFDYLPEHASLVMKYVTGISLAERLAQQPPLPVDEALSYIRDTCSALVYMHAREPEPVLHRDLKPANILVDIRGQTWLIDFGLAMASLAPTFQAEAPGQLVGGTLGFTPPEQWRGAAGLPSDIYALGATLHALLTNYRPGESELLQIAVGAAGLPPARRFNAGVPPAIEQLIQQAMSPDPAERPSAVAFLAIVEAAIERPAPASLPPLAAPVDTSGLVGRQMVIAELSARLAREHIVALVGQPGLGKTLLAAALTRGVGTPARTFWYQGVEGAGVEPLLRQLAAFLARDGYSTPWQIIARPGRGGDLLYEELANGLRGRGYSICLDDLHTFDEASITPLLLRLCAMARAGDLDLILTSRVIPPGAPVETIHQLAGLSQADVAALARQRHVVLTDDLVTALHARTEGNGMFLHLALTVIAAAADPARVIEEIDAVDTLGSYLLAEIDRHLKPPERAVMEATALLGDNGGDRDVLEAMLDADDLWEVLTDLRQRSLLIVGGGADPTYRLHAIVGAYYERRLGRRRQADLHRRAADHFATRPHAELRATEHYLSAGAAGPAAKLATGRIEAIIASGNAQALYDMLGRLRQALLEPAQQAEVDTAYGEVAVLLGRYDLARAALERALACEVMPAPEVIGRRHRLLALVIDRAAATDDDYVLAEEQCCIGMGALEGLEGLPVERVRLILQRAEILWHVGRYSDAESACRQGLDLLVAHRRYYPHEQAALRLRLGTLCAERGNYEQAIELIETSRRLAQQLDEPALKAAIWNNLGLYRGLIGQLDAALACHQASLEIKRHIGDLNGRVVSLYNIGVVALARGDAGEALDWLSQALALCDAHDLVQRRADVLTNIGAAHLLASDLELAEGALRQARRLFADLGNVQGEADCLYRLGDVALAAGDPTAAFRAGETARACAEAATSPAYLACALRVLGEALLAMGYGVDALPHLREARRIALVVRDPPDRAMIHLALARHAIASTELRQARRHLMLVRGLAQRYQLRHHQRLCEKLLTEIEE